MLQRLSIRGKILAVVSVPILVLLFAAGFFVNDARLQLQSAQNTSQLLEVVARIQTFNAAVNRESDMASNALSAWIDNRTLVERAQNNITTTISDLRGLAETDAATAQYLAAVEAAFEGGQELATGHVALSLAELREVRPTSDGSSAANEVWPSDDEIALLSQSFTAIQADVQAALDALGRDHPNWDPASRLISHLTQERNRTTRLLTESLSFREEFIAAQPATDQAWTRLEMAISDISDDATNSAPVLAAMKLKSGMATLADRRYGVLARTVAVVPTTAYYEDLTGFGIDFINEVQLLIRDPDLARALEAFYQTELLLSEMAREDYKVDQIIRAGSFQTGQADSIRTQFARSDFVREETREALSALNQGWNLPSAGVSFDTTSNSGYGTVRNRVSQGNNLQLAALEQQDWPTQMGLEIEAIRPYNNDTLRLVQTIAAERESSARLTAIATAAGSALVVALSLFLALLIARRIVNPLRRLTTTAAAVRQELPRLVERVALPGETVDVSEVQIPVESQDEVGRLAEAFNSVNATTLAIASEQAALRGAISEMFVNVARRDQVLLNRQLASIDEMERTEDNPETLTKLFALDHLATRMRRNSESLLVLAGIDTGRRLRRPMPLSDVIRTASSEIELYERVQLELDADPAMLGHSALTAAHLFAELLENATVFSDPGTPVVVRTGQTDNGFTVTVTDSGIGMTPEEVAEANSRVASTAASEILGAQRLGLFVVGRIARRIGARVEIASKEGEGTVATVTMPSSLFDLNSHSDSTPYAAPSSSDDSVQAPSALVNKDMDNEILDTAPSAASAVERAGVAAPTSPAVNVPAYQPAIIAEGPSLSSRAPRGSQSVEELVAADAAAAPEAQPVDLEQLTEGVTPSGLPTRRRRSGEPSAAETTSDSIPVIGLPVRATDEQLSALEADADSGFTPLVAASEVAPQSAERRAAMFRGFRSRREAAEPVVQLEPDAESLGQAVRRGAAVVGEDGTVAPAGFEPEAASASAPSVPSAPAGPVTAQSPQISAGYNDEPTGSTPSLDALAHSAPIPLLEEEEVYAPGFAEPLPQRFDDAPAEAATSSEPVQAEAPVADTPAAPFEPIPSAYEPASAETPLPGRQSLFSQPSAPTAGVEQVSLDDLTGYAPAPVSEPTPTVAPQFETPQQPAPSFAPEPAAPVSAPEPAPAAEVPFTTEPAPVPAIPAETPAAATAAPSLDDVLGVPAEQSEARGGFFSKLFSKKSKADKDEAPTPAPAASTATAASAPAVGPFTGGVPIQPEPIQPEAIQPEPIQDVDTQPTAASPAFPAPAQTFPAGIEPQIVQPQPAEPAPAAPAVDNRFGAMASAFQPQGGFQPEAGSFQPDAGGFAPEPFPAGSSITPAASAEPYNPGALGAPRYTSDDLAKPVGWEAAGETALQATAPDQATTYRPIVQLEPQPFDGPEEDMTSAVFSELSSLSSERPKVERTRAGLQKRRPAAALPVEVKPIEETVTFVHKERDPNEVRNRFSNFYSGTQRARHDVEAWEKSTHESPTDQ